MSSQRDALIDGNDVEMQVEHRLAGRCLIELGQPDAIGAGGLGVWLLGAVADRYGLPAALWISALMPVAGGVVALFLPSPRGSS